MFFFLHLKYQFLSTNHGGKSTELQGWVKIMMKDQNPNFGHFFLIKSSMIVLKLAFPEPFLVTE